MSHQNNEKFLSDMTLVQCKKCGNIQKLDIDFNYCRKCGHQLTEADRIIYQNLKSGKNIQGIGILIILSAIAIFHYFSRFFGSILFGIGVIIYFIGRIKNKRKKKIISQ
ncbi:MAG: hypothetical protein AB1410_03470 [Acidobacteriota bacterium]